MLVAGATLFTRCNMRNTEQEHKAFMDTLDARVGVFNNYRQRSKAVAYLDSAYNTGPQKNKFDLAHRYRILASSYNYEPYNPQMGLTYIDSALAIMDDEPEAFKIDYMQALFTKGVFLLKQNNYNSALQYYYQGKLFADKYLDACTSAKATGYLSSVAFSQQRYAQAIVFIKEEAEKLGKCEQNSELEKQSCLDNVGICFYRLKMHDSAIVYYKQALSLLEAYKQKNTSNANAVIVPGAVIKGNLGSAYESIGKLDEAARLYAESIAVTSKDVNAAEDAEYTRIKLARLHLKQGKLKEAYAGMQYERHLIDSLPGREKEISWLLLAKGYYDTTGDKLKAYAFYQRYISLRDSLNAENKEVLYYDIDKEFAQINSIANLKSDYKATRVSLFIAIAFAIMAVVIIYLVLKYYTTSKRNVAKLKQLNRQINGQNVTLQKTLNALQHSQQDNTRILRIVAHDLQNPIAAMVSLADILGEEENADDRKELTSMLKASGMSAISLVKSILHATPILELEPIDLQELLLQCVGLLQFRANEKNQTIVLNSEPVNVIADREKLWRVVNNLLVNAIKFSQQGRAITVGLQQTNHTAIISVIDEGVGIADDVRNFIFHQPDVAGREGTGGEQSHGMGLYIAKQLVEAHNGKIWFESEIGKGATFFIELPLNGGALA
jgi:signal transduction histidine kinase